MNSIPWNIAIDSKMLCFGFSIGAIHSVMLSFGFHPLIFQLINDIFEPRIVGSIIFFNGCPLRQKQFMIVVVGWTILHDHCLRITFRLWVFIIDKIINTFIVCIVFWLILIFNNLGHLYFFHSVCVMNLVFLHIQILPFKI